ncbi:MAG: hypothetical protein Q3977_04545, partial [Oscillospiraceae bacterium]|nr:hypothetical protein [Oscillospiraceae bacterium]
AIIFGVGEESTDLFSWINEELWDFSNGSAEARNQMLEEWKEAGGRTDLIEGFKLSLQSLKDICAAVSAGIRNIFDPMTSSKLIGITSKFRELAQAFQDWLWSPNQYADRWPVLQQIMDIAEGLATAVKIVLKVKRAFFAGVRQIIGADTIEKILAFASGFSKKLTKFADDLEANGFYKGITDFVGGFGPLFQSATTLVWDFVTQFWHDISAPFIKREDGTFEVTWFSPIANALMRMWEQCKILIDKIKNFYLGKIVTGFKIGKWFSGLWNTISGIFNNKGEPSFSEKIIQFFASIIDWFTEILTKINGLDYATVGRWFFGLWSNLEKTINSITSSQWYKDVAAWFDTTYKTVSDWVTKTWEQIKNFDFVGWLKDTWAKAKAIVEQIKQSQFVQDVSAWVKSAFGALGSWLTSLWEKIKTFDFQKVIDWFNNLWAEVKKLFAKNQDSWLAKLFPFFESIWNTLSDLVQKLLAFDFKGISEKFGEIWDSLTAWISGIFSKLGGFFRKTGKYRATLNKGLTIVTLCLGLAAIIIPIWKLITVVVNISKALSFFGQKLASSSGNTNTFTDKVSAIGGLFKSIGLMYA